MLDAKYVLCPVCGEVFTEACYGSTKHRERLLLKRNLLQKYYVEPLGGEAKETYDLVFEKTNLLDGMPEQIWVKVDRGAPEEYVRCCPKCSNLTPMPRYWGKVRSYVVCVAAMSGEGKTCLYNAMATVDNLSTLACADYPWRLTTMEMEDGKNKEGAATAVTSPGATRVFHIRARDDLDERQPPLANILFRDSPGELFDKTKPKRDNPFFNFLKTRKNYPGPDALIFLHSAEKDDANLLQVYATLKEHISAWPATAVVITHADKIQSWTQQTLDGTNVKLMDKDTFPECPKGLPGADYYSPNRVDQRRMLQDFIVRSHYFHLFHKDFPLTGKHSCCFLVKSCYQDSSGKLQYDHPINIMDPVIWLLNDCILTRPREENE